MKKIKLVLTSLSLLIMMTGCTKKENILDKDNPITIQVWHYYNGAQQEEFDNLVTTFNNTVGKEKGIIVKGAGHGTILDLETNVLDAINGKVGASEIPNVFAAYGDTAYQVDKLGYAVDLSEYFTEQELDKYVDGYLDEGYFSDDGTLKIFPIAKSVELLMLNKTDWDRFANATKASIDDLSTYEGITKIAKDYYDWTDSQTEIPNDGKAFFGRDALANYMFVGYRQLADDMISISNNKVSLNFEKDVVKKLWDNYYVPYISGYFTSSGKFRSDDVKVGNILACISSSSSVTYFPKEVFLNDAVNYPIDFEALVCPKFVDGDDYAVQQGAGMVVLKSDSKEQLASVEFLKWFTDDKQNIRFSNSSGYLPVTKSANDLEVITDTVELNATVKKALDASLKTITNNTMYTSAAFDKATSVRNIMESSMVTIAKADYETVKANLANGMSLKEAVGQFDNQEYFDNWYNEVKNQLNELIK